jgi:hypothetical protein
VGSKWCWRRRHHRPRLCFSNAFQPPTVRAALNGAIFRGSASDLPPNLARWTEELRKEEAHLEAWIADQSKENATSSLQNQDTFSLGRATAEQFAADSSAAVERVMRVRVDSKLTINWIARHMSEAPPDHENDAAMKKAERTMGRAYMSIGLFESAAEVQWLGGHLPPR